MANATQHYGNHRKWTPLFHFVASPLSMVFLVWSGRALYAHRTSEAGLIFVGALALFFANIVSRATALRVQDRVIRLEEKLRFARILPTELQSRIEELRPSHFVALRFASDSEVTGLVEKVLANPAMTQKEIKQAIKTWRPDYLRG